MIVGGGPGGLCAAIALLGKGIQVDVVELALDVRILGSELLLSSPNLRALDAIGVADDVVAAGVPISSVQFHTADGTEIANVPTPSVAREGLPPAVGITRHAFYGQLYDAAVAAGAKIAHETTVQEISDADNGVEVRLTDGRVSLYDLVVGADGWASTVRKLRFPKANLPQYAGQCVWRGRVPRNGERPLKEGSLRGYAGANHSAGLITVNDKHSYIFCLVSQPKPDRLDESTFMDTFKGLLEEFGGEAGWARDNLEEGTISLAALHHHVMDKPWHDGRVILIGDAAHTTTPHIGYGAGLAVEDAVVLGEMLGSSEDLAATLDEFVARRYERCKLVVDNSTQISRWQQGLDGEPAQAELTNQTWTALAEPM
nr:FAD-dependent monooxygenase [Gordonia humi]